MPVRSKKVSPSTIIESEHIEAIVLDVTLELWQNLFAPDQDNQMSVLSQSTVSLGCMVSVDFLQMESKQSKIRRALAPISDKLDYAASLNYSHVFLRIG